MFTKPINVSNEEFKLESPLSNTKREGQCPQHSEKEPPICFWYTTLQ